MKHTIRNIDTYSIRSKKSDTIVFKLNSDDFNSDKIRKITNYIKSLGYTIKKTRSYSKTKLMSWCKFIITTEQNNICWFTNDKLALDIVNKALLN